MRRSLKLLCGSILLLVLNFLNLIKTHHHQLSSSAYYKGGGGGVAIIIFEVDFSDTCLMTSAENSVSESSNLKLFSGGYPQTPLQIRDNAPPPLQKT